MENEWERIEDFVHQRSCLQGAYLEGVHVLYCPIKICILLNLLYVWASVHPTVILFFYIYFTITHKHIKSDTTHMIYFGMIYFLLHRNNVNVCFSDTISHIHTQKKSKPTT